MTKLTLSMDEEVVATAKRIARRHNQSVSAMFSNLVRAQLRNWGLGNPDQRPEGMVESTMDSAPEGGQP